MKALLLALCPLALVGCASAPSTISATSKPALPPQASNLPSIGPVYGPTNPAPDPGATRRHFASIVGLDPAKEKLYRELHANVWPEVIAAIHRANIRNFNIYLTEIEAKRYLVCTFEHIGSDPQKDFASMAADPVTREKWWPLTDACQIRLPGTAEGQQWRPMEQVMHLP